MKKYLEYATFAAILGIMVVAACTPTQVTQTELAGQLFCATATQVVKVDTVSVIGQDAATVAKYCEYFQGIPMPAPAPATTVVVVPAPRLVPSP